MSGIYIPGDNVPTKCIGCSFRDPEYGGSCILMPSFDADTYEEQFDRCPFKELRKRFGSVPDHGDLIDADELAFYVMDVCTVDSIRQRIWGLAMDVGGKMYKELIKELREYGDIWRDKLLYEAADAIEEVTAINERQLLEIAVLSKPHWIPVTERLPEEGVSVQVCFRSQGGIAQAVSERFVNDRNQSYWSGLCGMKPTHWMPLPTPPKEEAE